MADSVDVLAEARKDLLPTDKVCGNCMLWKPQVQDARGRWLGPCRLQPGRGDLPATAAPCERFLARGSKVPTAPPPEPTRRRSRVIAPVVRRAAVVEARRHEEVELGELTDMTRGELIEIIREAMGEGDTPPLANKWEGGTLVLQPANPELQPREIPIDMLLRKVVSVRDRLRVLEAKINGNSNLSDGEKVELQSYITRCYGSLTTFNVLFRDKADHFVGEKSSG